MLIGRIPLAVAFQNKQTLGRQGDIPSYRPQRQKPGRCVHPKLEGFLPQGQLKTGKGQTGQRVVRHMKQLVANSLNTIFRRVAGLFVT